MPKGSDVLIKSIQMHDDPVDEAISPARVGLSVKGIAPDDVQRGDLLSLPDSVKVSQEITLDYSKNKFFKGELTENQMFLVNIGLQIRPAKIISLNPMKLSVGKPVVFDKDEICVILKPESQTIRIVGSGTIIQ
jgi:selenocysteine-specific translation elongation factor